jgi:8-oxo-dGTP pyrophosphatase MutT (NUDIX family)
MARINLDEQTVRFRLADPKCKDSITMDYQATTSRATLLSDARLLVPYLRAQLAALAPAAFAPGAEAARAAGVLAPRYAVAGRPHLSFTVRSHDLSKHKGEISFPGGSRDLDDRSLSETALREAREEVGLDPVGIELLGPLPPVFAAVSNFVITPFVGWLGEGVPLLTPNPAEVAEVIYAPLTALAEPAIYHSELWQRFGTAHLVHFYDFGAYRIWGATARMLHSLIELLPPA